MIPTVLNLMKTYSRFFRLSTSSRKVPNFCIFHPILNTSRHGSPSRFVKFSYSNWIMNWQEFCSISYLIRALLEPNHGSCQTLSIWFVSAVVDQIWVW
jgi:hypothetical protein